MEACVCGGLQYIGDYVEFEVDTLGDREPVELMKDGGMWSRVWE